MRPATGQIRTYACADGSLSYSLRVTIPELIPLPDGVARRPTLLLGRDADGWTIAAAGEELERVLARITLGQWPPPEVNGAANGRTVVELADDLISFRHEDGEWKETTTADREWRRSWLSPFFDNVYPSQVNRALVIQYRKHLAREANRRAQLLEAGTPEYYPTRHGQKVRPLSVESRHKCVDFLAQVLDYAQELDETLPGGHVARQHRRKRTLPPRRQWLEAREAETFIRAARHVDQWRTPAMAERAEAIGRMRDDEGLVWREIAARAGTTISTVHKQYRYAKRPRTVGAAEAIAVTLLAGSMRAAEIGAIDLRDIRADGRIFQVHGTKTPSSRRTVQIVDRVAELIEQYIRDSGLTDPKGPAYPRRRRRGEKKLFRRDRHNVRQLVERIGGRARWLAAREGSTFPEKVTPHDLRRTCAALMLASNVDVGAVQEHLGHADPRVTLAIYNEVKEKDRVEEMARFQAALLDGVL